MVVNCCFYFHRSNLILVYEVRGKKREIKRVVFTGGRTALSKQGECQYWETWCSHEGKFPYVHLSLLTMLRTLRELWLSICMNVGFSRWTEGLEMFYEYSYASPKFLWDLKSQVERRWKLLTLKTFLVFWGDVLMFAQIWERFRKILCWIVTCLCPGGEITLSAEVWDSLAASCPCKLVCSWGVREGFPLIQYGDSCDLISSVYAVLRGSPLTFWPWHHTGSIFVISSWHCPFVDLWLLELVLSRVQVPHPLAISELFSCVILVPVTISGRPLFPCGQDIRAGGKPQFWPSLWWCRTLYYLQQVCQKEGI